MAGKLFHYKQGPASYTAAGLILGGQLVVPAAGLSGSLATLNGNAVMVASSVTTGAGGNGYLVIGVAGADANTGMLGVDASGNVIYPPVSGASLPAGWPGDGNLTTQDQLLDQSILGYTIPVYNHVDINVTYAANASFGTPLKLAANGTVTPWVPGTDTDVALIVGKCTAPGGVTVASNPVGRMYVRV